MSCLAMRPEPCSTDLDCGTIAAEQLAASLHWWAAFWLMGALQLGMYAAYSLLVRRWPRLRRSSSR